ncbi:MAG TPA: putative toxin-antitoxin system toxin component, PIN family [Macromonas sp.]|nr:putative toxin-antitoxin system toxin component, PIN family [Macromonas sp.]
MSVPCVVIDTNWVLDLWVFDDPGAQALRQAVQTGQVRWLACPPMRDELARVLTYPAVHKRLLASERAADTVLAGFDRWSQGVARPPACPWRCKDPDDQVFIDLAHAHQATLLSKDAAVLRLRTRLAQSGARVVSQWT